MLLRFGYGKKIRSNQSVFEGGPITTYVQLDNVDILPYGSTGAATAAPSTLIVDKESKESYLIAKVFSATHAALTAVTSTSDSVNLF